jgi:hypothetical protein
MSQFVTRVHVPQADGEKLARAQEPLVTPEVYADFQQFVLKEMANQVQSVARLPETYTLRPARTSPVT